MRIKYASEVSGTGGRGPAISHGTRNEARGTWSIAVVFAIILLSMTAPLCPNAMGQQSQIPAKKPVQGVQTQASVEKRVSETEKDIIKLEKQLNLYNIDTLPDVLMLCDKKIPLVREDVRERFEREFFFILENKGQLTTVIKRYFKYLPMISEEIQRQSLPQDLAFLAVAESSLHLRSSSPASAAGMWQFIKETGRMEGLLVNDSIDERYNVRRSTQAALSHLKKLYIEFNDWFLAMAAYNAGMARLKEAIENQNTREFLEMYLPEETERYVFRIMAFKEIILNRERYGITLTEQELYKPVMLTEIVFETNKEIHSNILAQAMEVSYRTFRFNNLHISKYKLPKGTYRINVPIEKKSVFLRNVKTYDGIKVL